MPTLPRVKARLSQISPLAFERLSRTVQLQSTCNELWSGIRVHCFKKTVLKPYHKFRPKAWVEVCSDRMGATPTNATSDDFMDATLRLAGRYTHGSSRS